MPGQHVTQAECNKQVVACASAFRWIRWLIMILVTIAGIGVAIVSGGMWMSWSAHTEASTLGHTVGEHVAAETQWTIAVNDKLKSIQASQLRLEERINKGFGGD